MSSTQLYFKARIADGTWHTQTNEPITAFAVSYDGIEWKEFSLEGMGVPSVVSGTSDRITGVVSETLTDSSGKYTAFRFILNGNVSTLVPSADQSPLKVYYGKDGANGANGSNGQTGAVGPKGDKGADGIAATVTVGTTTSGDVARVIGTGSPTNRILNFVLPKGDKGDPGDRGSNGRDGLTGPQGERGEKGESGRDGQDGTSFIIQNGVFYHTDKWNTLPAGYTGNWGTTLVSTTDSSDKLYPLPSLSHGNTDTLGYIVYVKGSYENPEGTYNYNLYLDLAEATVGGSLEAMKDWVILKNWSGVKGNPGATGATGARGATGPAGPSGATGADGIGIASTQARYAIYNTSTPLTVTGFTGSDLANFNMWSSTFPTPTSSKPFIQTCLYILYTDGSYEFRIVACTKWNGDNDVNDSVISFTQDGFDLPGSFALNEASDKTVDLTNKTPFTIYETEGAEQWRRLFVIMPMTSTSKTGTTTYKFGGGYIDAIVTLGEKADYMSKFRLTASMYRTSASVYYGKVDIVELSTNNASVINSDPLTQSAVRIVSSRSSGSNARSYIELFVWPFRIKQNAATIYPNVINSINVISSYNVELYKVNGIYALDTADRTGDYTTHDFIYSLPNGDNSIIKHVDIETPLMYEDPSRRIMVGTNRYIAGNTFDGSFTLTLPNRYYYNCTSNVFVPAVNSVGATLVFGRTITFITDAELVLFLNNTSVPVKYDRDREGNITRRYFDYNVIFENGKVATYKYNALCINNVIYFSITSTPVNTNIYIS
jgi:hypothetical protein